MEYAFFWMGACGSYMLYFHFSTLEEAQNLARAITCAQNVDIYGVEVFEEPEDGNERVYGVRYSDGEYTEF